MGFVIYVPFIVVDLIVANPVMPAVKVLVGHLARDAGFDAVRAPLTELSPERKAKLIEAFDAIMATA